MLSNAVKFTDNGQILIKAKLKPSNQAGLYFFDCSITDTGIGISQQKLPTLFEAFSQGDTSTTRKYGGTGLGLSITRKLCKLLGGDIEAISELGKGSCFKVTCIVKESVISAMPYTPRQFASLSIIVADKNPTNSLVIHKHLKRLGAQVVCCNTLDQLSLELGSKNRLFDIVLIDYQLYQSHHQDQQQIQDLTKCSSHTILMTAINDQIQPKDFITMGIDAYLAKPITPKGLNKVIEKCLTTDKVHSQNSGSVKQRQKASEQRDLLQGKHALLVEDNPVNQLVALSILKNIGMTADVAKNGLDAIEKLQSTEHSQCYEMILMDCQMPEMDGYETTARIRAGEAGEQAAKTPIIAMTANAMQGDKQKCFEVGMNDYMSKPINKATVLKTLNKWANQQHTN